MSPRSQAWPEFGRSTRPFLHLYEAITAGLREYAAGLSEYERRWFEAFITAFHGAFKCWEDVGRLRLCLERIDRARFRALKVIGHAYIHIAYDMPRVIADSLGTNRGRGRAMRSAYLGAREALLETFERSSVQVNIFGGVAYLFRIWRWMPFLKSWQFGIWASELRQNAWFIAEALLISPDREADEEELWNSVERRIKSACDSWNPFIWMKLLVPPEIPGPKDRPDILDAIEFATDVWTDDADGAETEDSTDDDSYLDPRDGRSGRL